MAEGAAVIFRCQCEQHRRCESCEIIPACCDPAGDDGIEGTLKHIASVARAAALFNHKPHICDIQFDVVANDLNNRIVIKTRTTPPSKRTSFTSTMRSPGSNFWMSMASRSCGIRTCSTPLSAANLRLLWPA